MQLFNSILFSLITWSNVSNSQSLQCNRIYARRSVYEMTESEIQKYVSALRQVNSGTKPTRWDRLVQMHPAYFNDVHSKYPFFAWHRQYLHELEKMLMAIDPTIRIPYWDWTQYYDRVDQDPVWKIFGKYGVRSRNYCVNDGRFTNFNGYYYMSSNTQPRTHCFQRRESFPSQMVSSIDNVIATIIDANDQTSFWRNTEYGPHAYIHNGIGSEFSTHTSPNDPLFFSHHAFVDKLWFDRQMRHPETVFQYPSPSSRTRLPGFNTMIYETFDPSSMCYTYRENRISWTLQQKDADAMATAASVTPEPFTITEDKVNAASGKGDKTVHADSVDGIFNLTAAVPPSMQPQFTDIDLNLSHINPALPDTSISLPVLNKLSVDYILKDLVGFHAHNRDHGLPERGPSGCKVESIPDPVGMDYIIKMEYDPVIFREIERKNALLISEQNKKCLEI